jgi:hypothetical protein
MDQAITFYHTGNGEENFFAALSVINKYGSSPV